LRYFIEFSYNGKNYFGYQIQPNAISVQEELEKALSTILREEIKTTEREERIPAFMRRKFLPF
jgi:tRNA pseudouridine38-40 synthase